MQNIFGPEAVGVVARILAFCTAIPFHESAHGFVSEKLGDPTARNAGRITLNPLKHLDPWGLIAMLTIGIGWAKPVPINPGYYKNRKVGMAMSSAAGPLSNLVLAFFNVLLYKILWYVFLGVAGAIAGWMTVVLEIVWILAYININLAIFNLLPIPPFDGSRIFSLFLPEKTYFAIQKYERYIMIALIILMFVLPRVTDFNPIGWLLGTVGGYVMQGLGWLTGFVDLLAKLILGL